MTSDSVHSVNIHELISERSRQVDHSDMATIIGRLPDQIETALADKIASVGSRDFDNVVLAGMGGSALPMDVVLDVFGSSISIPVQIWRRYDLPPNVTGTSLVLVSSFSGNTEEALSALEHLPVQASNAIIVCGGGQLFRLGREKDIPVIRIPVEREPKGFQPRSAVGYMVTYLARILSDAGVMPNADAQLAAAASHLRSIDTRTPAQEVALWLRDRIPVIYTDESHLTSVARIAKIKFNENAKRPAFFNCIPEANHNEMIGFSAPLGQFGLLYIHDSDSHPRIRRRFYVMKDVFFEAGLRHVSFREWIMPGKSRAEKIFASLAFADWCSYTLALIDNIDPTPVELVEQFKGRLD